MDEGAREEGSSSRSANEVLSCVRGADGRVQVRLSNGSSFFVSPNFLDGRDITPGCVISEADEHAAAGEDERIRAYDKGLELLARREHTGYELGLKLQKRGFESEAVSAVLRGLAQAGYLSDRRFAEAWVANRLKRNPEGKPRLAAGLARHGVGRDIIESVLKELYTAEASEEALEKAAGRMMRSGNIDEVSLLRKLTAKGFPYRQAMDHLQKLHFSSESD